MSTMLIPALSTAHSIPLGASTFSFTPTKTGTFPITCSMGSRIGTLNVV